MMTEGHLCNCSYWWNVFPIKFNIHGSDNNYFQAASSNVVHITGSDLRNCCVYKQKTGQRSEYCGICWRFAILSAFTSNIRLTRSVGHLRTSTKSHNVHQEIPFSAYEHAVSEILLKAIEGLLRWSISCSAGEASFSNPTTTPLEKVAPCLRLGRIYTNSTWECHYSLAAALLNQ